MTLTISEDKRCEINTEIKIHINRQLYEKGYITEEMYQKASDIIRKCCNRLKTVV